jgi:hypothetical protein
VIHGIWGEPFIDLEPYLDLAGLDVVHEEVCLGLAQVPAAYTGGSHRSMGIMPSALEAEAGTDYVAVLRSLSEAERTTFASLADDPLAAREADTLDFGEERPLTLSRRQQLWLEYRFGVYFPWQVYYEMIPNHYWDEKSDAEGKRFTREARTFFPRTIELVQRLPFSQIGRCNIMGLKAHHHGTVHLDGDPKTKPEVDHFVALCPGGNKRLFLWDDERSERLFVDRRAYWFNDSDYHGVEPAPFFRYSIRVDGVFRPEFLRELRESRAAAASR